MSWQRRVEKYHAEVNRREEEVAKVQEAELGHIAEKFPPLFAVLEKFDCRRLLLQMRDEVWKLGDVSVFPSLDKITEETPIKAGVSLFARWPHYSPSHYEGGGLGEFNDSFEVPPSIKIETCGLYIVAKYNDEFELKHVRRDAILVYVSGSAAPSRPRREDNYVKADDPSARSLIEGLLVEDILDRQSQEDIPYARKKRAESRVVRAIVEEGLVPPKGFEYLLKLAGEDRIKIENWEAFCVHTAKQLMIKWWKLGVNQILEDVRNDVSDVKDWPAKLGSWQFILPKEGVANKLLWANLWPNTKGAEFQYALPWAVDNDYDYIGRIHDLLKGNVGVAARLGSENEAKEAVSPYLETIIYHVVRGEYQHSARPSWGPDRTEIDFSLRLFGDCVKVEVKPPYNDSFKSSEQSAKARTFPLNEFGSPNALKEGIAQYLKEFESQKK